jgi:hypothetical protein
MATAHFYAQHLLSSASVLEETIVKAGASVVSFRAQDL